MMKISTLKNLTCVATLAIALATNNFVVADTVVGNGGFEDAGSDGAADSDIWFEFAGGAAGTESVRDDSNPFEGSFAHLLTAVGDDTTGATAGITQNSADAGFLLQENTPVTASFQWNGNLGPGGVAFAALRILGSDGTIFADTGLQPLAGTGGLYSEQTLPSLMVPSFGGAPADSFAAFLEISVSAGGFNGSIASGFVDAVDIQGTAIPEPTSVAIISIAGLGLVARRRR